MSDVTLYYFPGSYYSFKVSFITAYYLLKHTPKGDLYLTALLLANSWPNSPSFWPSSVDIGRGRLMCTVSINLHTGSMIMALSFTILCIWAGVMNAHKAGVWRKSFSVWHLPYKKTLFALSLRLSACFAPHPTLDMHPGIKIGRSVNMCILLTSIQ